MRLPPAASGTGAFLRKKKRRRFYLPAAAVRGLGFMPSRARQAFPAIVFKARARTAPRGGRPGNLPGDSEEYAKR